MAAHIKVVPFGFLGNLEEERKTKSTFFGDLYKLKLVILSVLLNHNFFELKYAGGVVHFEDCKGGLSEDHQKVSLGDVYGIDRLLKGQFLIKYWRSLDGILPETVAVEDVTADYEYFPHYISISLQFFCT